MTASVLIEPLDVLLFRDGKPFSAGSDHTARSLFPPPPVTLAGFLRTRLLLDAGLDWTEARRRFGDLGGPDGYGDFRLEAVLVRRDGEDFVPTPRDVVRSKSRPDSLSILQPKPKDAAPLVISNFPDPDLRHLWANGPGPVETPGGFVSLRDLFAHCLLGTAPPQVLDEDKLAMREPRVGTAIDVQRGTASDGQLYAVDFLRLADGVGFHVRVSGVEWPRRGLDTLGGERRPVRWTSIEDWSPPPTGAIEQKVAADRRFKLVLLAPAVFDSGWAPGRRFRQTIGEHGLEVRLVAAAVGRPVALGGFDLHRRRPKEMRLAAPAGSVYFFEVAAGDPAGLVAEWRMRCVSDRDWEAGMGLSVIGGWDHA